jgi:rod shape-determining protein MreD
MFRYIGLAGIVPNLILILVVSTAFMRGRMSGMLVGFFGGLLVDLMSGMLVGLCTLFYLLIGYFAGFSHRYYDRDDYTIPVILVAISDLVYGFLYYVFNFLLRGRLNFLYYFRRIILPEMIYTIAVSILLYKLLHMINNHLDRKINEEA